MLKGNAHCSIIKAVELIRKRYAPCPMRYAKFLKEI